MCLRVRSEKEMTQLDRQPLITYDGGFFYPLDNQRYTVDPIVPGRFKQQQPTAVKPSYITTSGSSNTTARMTPTRANTECDEMMDAYDEYYGGDNSSNNTKPNIFVRDAWNRRTHKQAVDQGKSLSFIYNGGSSSGARRVVRPIACNTTDDRFKAYDANNALKVYHFAKIEEMQIV